MQHVQARLDMHSFFRRLSFLNLESCQKLARGLLHLSVAFLISDLLLYETAISGSHSLWQTHKIDFFPGPANNAAMCSGTMH